MNTRINKTVLLIILMICLATAVYSAVGTFTFRTSGAADTTEAVDLRYPQKVPEDASVTTDSIADGSITNDKLAEPVSVANGGTGKTTAAEALAALGGASLNGSSTVDFAAQDLSLVSRPMYSAGVDFRAYSSTGVLAADNTYVTATYTAETYDVSSNLNPATGDITITETGLYLIDASFFVDAPTNAGHIYMQLTDSPVTDSFRDTTTTFRAGVTGFPSVAILIKLTAGTYSLRFKQVSGGAETIRLVAIVVTQLRRF